MEYGDQVTAMRDPNGDALPCPTVEREHEFITSDLFAHGYFYLSGEHRRTFGTRGGAHRDVEERPHRTPQGPPV